jgi:uncharacterized membrane protein YhaH (DUF805 family)
MDLVRLCFSFYGRVNRAKYWIGFGIAYGIFQALGIAALPCCLRFFQYRLGASTAHRLTLRKGCG